MSNLSDFTELCTSDISEKDLQKLTVRVDREGQLYLIISNE